MVAVVDDEDDESSKKESIDVSLGRVILAGRLVVDHPQWAAALPIVTLSQQCIPIAIIGCAGGLVAWLYFVILEASLHFVWKTMPDYLWKNANAIDENDGGITNSGFFLLHPMVWIPVTTFTFATIMALATIALGEPIDLATTVFCVHHHGWLSMQHVIPIAVTSLCTILAGASLGPEAPLVSICAALAGYLSKTVMGHTDRHMIRKHTVMGVSAFVRFLVCGLQTYVASQY